jgi:NAD(P)H-hydrate epimerase
MNILKETKCNVVLTPHPKEMERLSGVKVTDILSDPINIAKRLASEYSLTLLLKGSATVVTDGKDVYISDRGCSGMATAGSGDVLTGIILSLLAQNYSPEEAAIIGVVLHSLAGDLAAKDVSEQALIASDIIENIGKAYLTLLKK